MYIFIVNPKAGNGRAEQVMRELEPMLQERAVSYQIVKPTTPDETSAMSRSAAEREDCTAVISVGGDGTAFDVATGMMDTGKPLGLIPAGTGNDFIKSLPYPSDPKEALAFILSHEPRPVDVGRINDRYFLNVCGTGFDVTVLEQAEHYKKKYKGLMPYLLGLIRAISIHKPIHIRCVYDGHETEKDVLICAVANGRFFGGGIPICKPAEPDDGLLDLVMVHNVPRWKIPFYLPGLLTGKLLNFKVTEHIRCRSVSIDAADMSVQMDGEIRKMERAEFSVMPGMLNLFW